MSKTKTSPPHIRLKPIIMPAQHGSWGFVLEPILLGLLVAFSLPGLCLALAGFFAFLSHRPLQVLLSDQKRGRRLARTAVAQKFVLGFGLIALLGVALSLYQGGFVFLPPLFLALPFGLIFLIYDLGPQRRSWQAELAGPIAFAALATAMALQAQWSIGPAYALWAVLVARAVPSILYVRERLHLDKGQPTNTPLAIGAHGVGLVLMMALLWAKFLPALSLLAFVVLLIRAIMGLSPYRRPVAVKVIGFSEMALGLLVVFCVALGYWLA